MTTSYTVEQIVGRFQVMQLQEESSYSYRNCLPEDKRDTYLNISWREKICQWSYNVVDHFDLSREVVDVSLNLFDRYMASRGNECTGNLALLASLTTLHIACKLHTDESKKIKVETLASLSRGQFGPKDICEMELEILEALGWHLHPPTQYAFISHLMFFLPIEAPASARKEMYEMARYVTELAVCDAYFVDARSSTVAFAAILNVMEGMTYSRLSAGIRARFLRDLAEQLGMSYADPSVLAARGRLRAIVSTSDGNGDSNNSNTTTTEVVEQRKQQRRQQPPATKKIQNDSPPLGSFSFFSAVASAAAVVVASKQTSPMVMGAGAHSRSNSFDSKGSFRYSPSPHPSHRRFVMAASSPASSRAELSGSPLVAAVQ